MTGYVVATAGHVDHGKSTLVRALTGIEPDRWSEEQRRGLTIDLGFAWTTLPSGRSVAFVDVPGHERFLGNMLAGLGPAPVVCFVVAADEGWSAQSDDHRDALAALGIQHGLIAVTRVDRAPDLADTVIAQTRAELAGTGLQDAPAVAVSAVKGTGTDQVRTALDEVLAGVPKPDPAARMRLWLDRAFTITGAGTVVTGTLAGGALHRGDDLTLVGAEETRAVTIRGIESQGERHDLLEPVARAGVNLRGVSTHQVARGDVLVTPGAWPQTGVVDVRRTSGPSYDDIPQHLTVHVGTAAVPARLRPFDADHARITLRRELPVVLGDRFVLRDPGRAGVLGGAQVLDADPPALRRRGDGVRRADALAGADTAGDIVAEVARRGAVEVERLVKLNLAEPDTTVPQGVREVGGWWVYDPTYDDWKTRLTTWVHQVHQGDPLSQGVSQGALLSELAIPTTTLLDALVRDSELEQAAGHVRVPGRSDDLGPAETAVTELEQRLGAAPFAAPLADDLDELGLGPREVAAAERVGRLLRLGEVVLLPTAPALAMRELVQLPQPFTTSQARQALDTSRRVAIPLLEHLDRRGWTRRLDAGHREVAR